MMAPFNSDFGHIVELNCLCDQEKYQMNDA